MIYHLFNGSMTHFTSIIEGILVNADKTNSNGILDHFFYITIPQKFLFGKQEEELSKFKNVFVKNNCTQYHFVKYNFKNAISFIDNLRTSDRFIFHGIQSNIKYNIIYLIYKPKLLKKIVIVEWGVKEFNRASIKAKILQWLNNLLLEKYKYVITMTFDEKKILERNAPKANVIVLNYLTSTKDYYKNISYQQILKRNSVLTIIVSHSGWEHNEHIESFKQIEHLRNEQILVICPLCYGNKEYIECVIKSGIEIFGRKFEYFTKLKERDEYVDLIVSSHIYITSAKNQTGLFMSSVSIANGLKIFARDTILNYYKELGCDLYDVKRFSELTFSDLARPMSEEIFYKNRLAMLRHSNTEKLSKMWNLIYQE